MQDNGVAMIVLVDYLLVIDGHAHGLAQPDVLKVALVNPHEDNLVGAGQLLGILEGGVAIDYLHGIVVAGLDDGPVNLAGAQGRLQGGRVSDVEHPEGIHVGQLVPRVYRVFLPVVGVADQVMGAAGDGVFQDEGAGAHRIMPVLHAAVFLDYLRRVDEHVVGEAHPDLERGEHIIVALDRHRPFIGGLG